MSSAEQFYPIRRTLWMEITKVVYKSLNDERTRHLLMGLMRFLIKVEVEEWTAQSEKSLRMGGQRNFHELCDPDSSKVAECLAFFMSHNFFEKFQSKLYDVGPKGDQDSLIGAIVEFSCPRQQEGKNTKAKMSE